MDRKFLIGLGCFIFGLIFGIIASINTNLQLQSLLLKHDAVMGGVRAIDSEFRKIYRAGNMEQVNEAILHGDHIRSGLKAILDVGK